MAIDPAIFQQIVGVFQTDLDEQLESFTDALLILENPATPSADYESAFADAMRSAHSIKGGAKGLGLKPIEEVSHQWESLLLALKKGPSRPSTAFVDLCGEGCALLRDAVAVYVQDQHGVVDFAPYITRLRRDALGISDQSPGEAKAPIPGETPNRGPIRSGLAPALFKKVIKTYRKDLEDQLETITKGLQRLIVEVLNAADRSRELLDIKRAAHSITGAARGLGLPEFAEISSRLENIFGELAHSNGTISAGLAGACTSGFDAMRASAAAYAEAGESDIAFDAHIKNLDLAIAAQRQSVPEPPQGSPTAAADESTPERHEIRTAVTTETRSNRSGTNTTRFSDSAAGEVIRVQSVRLETVTGLTDELRVTRAALGNHHRSLSGIRHRLGKALGGWQRNLAELQTDGSRGAANVAALVDDMFSEVGDLDRSLTTYHNSMHQSLRTFDRLSSSLGNDLKRLRFVRMETLFKPLTNAMRPVARELGKNVQVVTHGEQVEADRVLLDRLRSPLMHLARNATDHGIEAPEVRLALGKERIGTIALSARNEGASVVIEVSDDGGGIDVERISEAALESRLVSSSQLERMSREQRMKLILAPGFSSKTEVTHLSGRGVGMDVVQTTIEQLNGTLSISSESMVGTTFTIHVPPILAVQRGIMLRCAGANFIIPTIAVRSVHDFSARDLAEVEGELVVLLHDDAVALRRLSTVLGLPGSDDDLPEHMIAVVLDQGPQRIALLVDDAFDEREIVVKPLPFPIESVAHVSGAIYDDAGMVIMVLDADALIASALARNQRPMRRETKAATHVPRILIVDDSLTTRTLEKNILEAHGYLVSTCNDGREALDALQADSAYDLIITDIEMPRMNGFEFTEAVKSATALRSIPLIIVSSLESNAGRERGMKAGADAYIVKGEFETRILLEAVQRNL
jgi:two-component system, chemotaxis family, sensor kinase CheA